MYKIFLFEILVEYDKNKSGFIRGKSTNRALDADFTLRMPIQYKESKCVSKKTF